MPRVDIFIRVRNDSGEDNGHATFSLEPQLINELSRHFTPEHLAAYFGDLIRVQCMQVLYRVPGLPQDGVSSVRSWGVAWDRVGGEDIREPLVRELHDFARNLREVDPNEQVSIPLGNLPLEQVRHLLEQGGLIPSEVNEPPMEQGEFVAETPEQFAERMLIEEGVESPEEARARFISDLNARGAISNRTTAELLGVDQEPPRLTAQERLQEAISRRDPVRGRQEHGVMLDDAAHFASDPVDAAHFSLDTEFPISDIAIPQDPERRRAMREAFRRSFFDGSIGSQQPNPRQEPLRHQEFLRSVQGQMTSGIEPTSELATRRRTRNTIRNVEDTQPTPETNEDRSSIPTRYQRKPVI